VRLVERRHGGAAVCALERTARCRAEREVQHVVDDAVRLEPSASSVSERQRSAAPSGASASRERLRQVLR
jgi:hypothetical protein